MYDDNNVVHGGWVVGDMTVKRGNMTEEDVRRPEVTRGGGIVAVVVCILYIPNSIYIFQLFST